MHKIAMNGIVWCYCAPCVMNSENKVGGVAECLYCSESNEMYTRVMEQLEKVELVYKLK